MIVSPIFWYSKFCLFFPVNCFIRICSHSCHKISLTRQNIFVTQYVILDTVIQKVPQLLSHDRNNWFNNLHEYICIQYYVSRIVILFKISVLLCKLFRLCKPFELWSHIYICPRVNMVIKSCSANNPLNESVLSWKNCIKVCHLQVYVNFTRAIFNRLI